jgi:putative transposase
MKLNRRKIHWIIRQKQDGVSSKEIAKDIDITCRRVEQIWKYFKDYGCEPIIGKEVGRPRKPYDEKEAMIIKEAPLRFGFGARMLEVILTKMYNVTIPHNRIHMYLLSQGLSVQDPKKQKRRKWVRYERKHSMSAGLIDWHDNKQTGMKICVILDDASRKILAGGEFQTINTENSILVVDQMVWNYWWLCPMREMIMDHGTEFGGNRILENGNSKGRFQNYLEELGIKPIMARVKHPQTNGKLEKWFDTYRRFRQNFDLLREFIEWYNDRPHGSLDFERLETPNQAFLKKMPQEAFFGIGNRLFGL